MAKDPLLSKSFFSVESTASDIKDEEEVIDALIRKMLYPHLSVDKTPTYYQSGHSLPDLLAYINTPEHAILEQELALTLDKIKNWAEHNSIEEADTLVTFRQKIAIPADRVSLIYGDGKKSLEKIAVFLEDVEIDLAIRKTVITNLLADRELEKCINGCYSRIVNAAFQLQEHRFSKHQIEHWIRSYAKDLARRVATLRQFAMPYSYQELVCKVADCSETYNGLHANNFLVTKAKEYGFPIDDVMDEGAKALGLSLSSEKKQIILNRYLAHLETLVTAKGFILFLSHKLHEEFEKVMAGELDYSEKINRIVNKLDSIGRDPWFDTKTVGLEEIFSPEGVLKSEEHLQITLTERLIQRGFIYAEGLLVLSSTSGKLKCRRFPAAIELSWLWIDEQRKPFLELMHESRLELLKVSTKGNNGVAVLENFPYYRFITDIEDLLLVVKHAPRLEQKAFLYWVTMDHAVSLLKERPSPQLFVQLLNSNINKEEAESLIRRCGDDFIRMMVHKGMIESDFKMQFSGLTFLLEPENYDFKSKQEGLTLTKVLIKRLLENNYKNFNLYNFYELRQIDYLDGIDFSKVNLKNSHFFQSMSYVRFDEAELTGTCFWQSLKFVSFSNTDLRKVSFIRLSNREYKSLFLEAAILSTETFKAFRQANLLSFAGANLKEVSFQHLAIRDHLERLDFTNTNLESVDLSELDLRHTVLHGAKLVNANLIGTNIKPYLVNEKTNLQGSHMFSSLVVNLNEKGIKRFDRCYIISDLGDFEERPFLSFQKTSFKGSYFSGKAIKANFIESDLTGATFKPYQGLDTDRFNTELGESFMLVALNAQKSRLENLSFFQVKFLSDVTFTRSSLKGMNFNGVEMNADLLFVFYEQGIRNFKGVVNLKGQLPKKLPPFPVLNAELNKQTFLHLYHQGLRDFRGSNLNSFYLGQVLLQQTISEIDLKLEGTVYKPSILNCGLRQKRAAASALTAASCAVYFLFQPRQVDEQRLTLDDIHLAEKSSNAPQPILRREHILGANPLFIMREQVNEIHFYWGYPPDEAELFKSLDFTKKSISFNVRSGVTLYYYIYQKYTNTSLLQLFIKQLHGAEFPSVTIKYYDQASQAYALRSTNGVLSTHREERSLSKKFREILADSKSIVSTPPQPKKINYQTRLRGIYSNIKKGMGQGFRSGIRQGAQYEVGAAAMQLVIQWLIQRGSSPKELGTETKEALNLLARDVAEKVGEERGASQQQIQTVYEVTKQCIARSECASEEDVIHDVIDSMKNIRPDLVIGNEVLWKKIKEFFENIGYFFIEKFNEIKQFFINNQDQTANLLTIPSGGVAFGIYRSRTLLKRKLVAWYESPILIRLIKEIEATFDLFEYEVQLNDAFSEEYLAGFLFEIWGTLANHGVNNSSSHETLLTLLGNITFVKQTDVKLTESVVIEEPPREKSLFPTTQTTHRQKKRSVALNGQNEMYREDAIEKRAAAYIANFERSKRYLNKSKKVAKVSRQFSLVPIKQVKPYTHATEGMPFQAKLTKKSSTHHDDQYTFFSQTPVLVHHERFKDKDKYKKKDQVNHVKSHEKKSKLYQNQLSKSFVQTVTTHQQNVMHKHLNDNGLFKTSNISHAKNYSAMVTNEKNNSYFHLPQRLGITNVTATSDIPCTLFALNMLVRRKLHHPCKLPLTIKRKKMLQKAEKKFENMKHLNFS